MLETRHFLSAERFGLMKDGVVIINTARGDVIDPCALLGALAKGQVAAAGLDVLPGETKLREETLRLETLCGDSSDLETQLANHLLLQHPKVIVTPHCAFFTREAALRLMEVTGGNIEAFVREEPRNIVSTGTHRKV
jgi:D-lactate dehydrogenase